MPQEVVRLLDRHGAQVTAIKEKDERIAKLLARIEKLLALVEGARDVIDDCLMDGLSDPFADAAGEWLEAYAADAKLAKEDSE